MPGKHPHSSLDVSPSFTSRLVNKFSFSHGSFNVSKQSSPREQEAGRFRRQCSLRHTTKFCYERSPCVQEPVKERRLFFADGTDDCRPRRSVEQSAECEPLLDGESHCQRDCLSPRSLKTAPELDAAHIWPGHSRHRAPGFVGDYSDQEAKKARLDIKSAKKAEEDGPVTYSEMHRLVSSDDYLLARGANPRTGVVTPGSHSASSSIDRNQNDLSRIGRQVPSSRWRQRGDQWVSLELDEPTPVSTSLADEPLEHQCQTLRTPQKLATQEKRDSLLDNGGMQGDHTMSPAYGPTVAPPMHQYPLEASMKQKGVESGVEQTSLQDNGNLNRPIKRKPVGSPPGRSPAEPASHPQRGTSGSTDTVRKNPIFHSELRSSSAPDPLKARLFRSQPVEKNLPRLPLASDTESQTGDDPFLGVLQTDQQVDVPNSKTSNISGRHTIEKELPCLPTNSGPSQSMSDQLPYPTTPKGENGVSMKGSPTLRIAPPKGPRGGNPVYPYIRTQKPILPGHQTARHIKPIGERVMPIPEYDNPPKHLSPLMRTTGPKLGGPRVVHPPGTKVLNRTRQAFDPWSNITTIPTDMSMEARRPQRPIRVTPGPQPPDRWMVNRGQRGFRPRPHPSSGTDIIMNTTTNTSADAIMSIPMPRIRPREIGRPPLPTRAGGMYVVPRIGPTPNRSESTDAEVQHLWMPPATQTMAEEDYLVPETSLMPKPLKPRLQIFQEPIEPNNIPFDCGETRLTDLGLMRRCSHCNRGFVDVKLHNTDSVTPTSALRRDFDKLDAGTKSLHPKGSPLPELPQENILQRNPDTQSQTSSHLQKNVDAEDERDHTICCPECCKLDCHEGCLGHPSSTCASDLNNALWSDAQSSGSTSSSEQEMQEEARAETKREKGKSYRLAVFNPVLKRSHKKEEVSKSGNHIQAALSKAAPVELTMEPPTPAIDARYHSVKQLPDAVAAALSAMEPPSQKRMKETVAAAFSVTRPSQQKGSAPRPSFHRRQRSSSLPIIGTGIPSRTSNEDNRYHRSASGASRLRVPSPLSFAMSCLNSSKDGSSGSRNASGASIKTIELQVPNLVSLASCGSYAAIGDLLLIPLEAGKMWVRNHPQVLNLGKDLAQRGWVMAQLMMRTGWRLWAMVFVYSKTGKIKFHLSKGETASGFVLDVGRSVLYLLVFATLSTFTIRVLGLVIGLMGIVGWVVRTVFWVLRGILGVGQVK